MDLERMIGNMIPKMEASGHLSDTEFVVFTILSLLHENMEEMMACDQSYADMIYGVQDALKGVSCVF